MDYVARATMTRHRSWDGFMDARASGSGRLLLLTTRAAMTHHAFVFQPDDTVLVGRASAGAPEAVHDAPDARRRIPMMPGAPSLSFALSPAWALGEAARPHGGMPEHHVTTQHTP